MVLRRSAELPRDIGGAWGVGTWAVGARSELMRSPNRAWAGIGLKIHDGGMSRVVAEPLENGKFRSVLAPPDPTDVPELVEPEVLLNVLGFIVATYVGGQLLSAWASSLDLEKMAASVS